VLLEAGARVCVDQDHMLEPLYEAAFQGATASIRLLLSYGVDDDHIDDQCTAALIVACEAGHLDLVQLRSRKVRT
jgi:ankyrin repeat protein